ncbi:hypothetical protein ACQPZP_10010 [Spirillospora sp. CA-142024]|uniref:hypothetical protein n=1 Tax=Spirillospora sp. CA-142024 TaxID=3240036 RepID=UPI003D8EBD14
MRIRTTAIAATAALAFAAPSIGAASTANAATTQAAASAPVAGGLHVSTKLIEGRYLTVYTNDDDGTIYGKAVLDQKKRDFTVCDKRKDGHGVYVSFQNQSHMEHPKPYYWDKKSGSKCSHYKKAPKKKQIAVCRSDAWWDTCVEHGITWQ